MPPSTRPSVASRTMNLFFSEKSMMRCSITRGTLGAWSVRSVERGRCADARALRTLRRSHNVLWRDLPQFTAITAPGRSVIHHLRELAAYMIVLVAQLGVLVRR